MKMTESEHNTMTAILINRLERYKGDNAVVNPMDLDEEMSNEFMIYVRVNNLRLSAAGTDHKFSDVEKEFLRDMLIEYRDSSNPNETGKSDIASMLILLQ